MLLRKLGWKVLRFWDEDILSNPKLVARKIMKKVNPLPKKRLAVVELFCGAGGLAHGFFLEGIDIIAGFDIDKTCKYAYERNNLARFYFQKLENINGSEIKKLYPKGSLKILAGCAPCQPFSPYVHNRKKKSDKWKLLYTFSRLVNEVEPDIITMENVPTLLSYKNGRILTDFIDNLKKNGYFVWHKVVKCTEYGIPQYRRRLVLLASRLGEIALLPKTHSAKHFLNVRDAIQDLSPIEAGGFDKEDPLHRSRNLTPINMLRIRTTPEGGNWRSWPKELILECHKKKSGKSFKRNVYGRMSWKEPSPTITTEFIGLGNGRFGHPVQNRAISLREAALLQTFPFYYDFIDPKAHFSGQRIAIHIGNAVPVRLGQVIAKSIKQHVEAVNLA
jgi:DNA (cytosine-5)-methyltransferase 1